MDRVFDFNDPRPEEVRTDYPLAEIPVFDSTADEPSPENPILILQDPQAALHHHERGVFRHPMTGAGFDYTSEGQKLTARILRIDRRFLKVLSWLGENRIPVRLSGRHVKDGHAIYRIHAVDPNERTNEPSSEDGMLQLAISRLYASRPRTEQETEEEEMTKQAEVMLTDLPSMTNFLHCAGDALPPEIRAWAHRSIKMLRTGGISPEERRHAQRSLSMMLNIQWKGDYFESIDPDAARRILDEEVYGLENVKQRIIETIIQINRTHTLPAYGLLLVGPAGIGKSQVAYAVARILRLPWTSLDMSTIHESEALTGSPRIYSNAKPGRIMEAYAQAGSSNLVFIINELDKADSGSTLGNPADALLTLLDNLGFTDNYIECVIPTTGVYPIATANDKSRISEPLMTRFAVIDIPDYTAEEKKIIFSRFSLPRVLKRLGMREEECVVTDGAAEAVVAACMDKPGCRELEQIAEHLAAHALFRIETEKIPYVVYDEKNVKELLER
ncbi:MAG: AAA family ATPase [Lachnospiraceae bacterium]|nr:AAA family ATPase [Lachnospiraceae bacterium]